MNEITDLLARGPRVINVGLESFAEDLERAAVPVLHVAWAPPAGGEPRKAALLADLDTDQVAEANREALQRLVEAQPVLVDCRPAREAIGLTGRVVLHAGPPVSWERMCATMQAAILCAIRYEGWAGHDAAAHELVARGDVHVEPCHAHGAVGPMTGMITPSMPVFVVENRPRGNRAVATINEGLGRVEDCLRVIRARCADVLCFSSYWVGSLRNFLTLSWVAHWEGQRVCKHTHGELGIAAAAGQHVLLAIPNAVDGAQQTTAIMADDILTRPLPIAIGPRWGTIERPGLGVDVDEARLQHYHECFLRDGQFLPYRREAASS